MKKLSTEEFIAKARAVHGDKYDYSKVEYVNNCTKITIICPVHGKFKQIPSNHLKGCGCAKCVGLSKTTEEFIEQARKIHGDKYDYSKVEYVNARTKVCIICMEHGEFEQTPNRHLTGNGCPKCAGNKKLITEDFIQKARLVHGNKYDYSKVEYIKATSKVTIICPEHGEFEQTPNSHLTGNGCPKCNGGIKYTQDEFIQKAREIHRDKYDYSKIKYVNTRTKVCIICPEHGEFKQNAIGHLSGNGCPKCNGGIKYTQDEFIQKAREIHRDKYDYSKVEYVNISTKVCIICPEHGEFKQTPNSHLQGCGCPKCKASRIENTVAIKLSTIGLIENKDNNISKDVFIRQKRFDWLKYYNKMPLDFYIPIINLAIECQGDDHFIPINRGNWSDSEMNRRLIQRQKYDKKKKELCDKYGIEIIYLLDKKYVSKLKNGEKYFTTIKSLKEYIVDKLNQAGVTLEHNKH